MASTYTPLGIELQATGENAGTWGTKTNTNLSIIEQISGGYSAHGTGGFHDMGMGGGDMGMGQMGGDMQGQQFDQGFQIKSNPEHGKMLKKVGPSDLKMFIGGLSHETTTDKLKDYFATWGEG